MSHFGFIVVLGVSFLASVPAMDYDVTVDLETGAVEPGGLAEGVEWQVPLSTPSSKSKSNSKCRRQGVLKLTFDGDDLECVDIHLKFENAQRWPFHIRDSLAFEPKGVTDTQDNVAEVTTWNKDISVYRRNSRGVWQLQANATNFLQGTVKMIVANNKFYASNGAKNFSVKRSRMYPINKAAADDSTFNLYLGLNRGAETDWRQGTGLCWVGLSWRDERCGSVNWLKDLE